LHGSGAWFYSIYSCRFWCLNPILVAIVSLMFGYADSVGIQLGLLDVGIPASIISMFPYVLALIVLLLSSLIRNYRYSTNKLDKRGNSIFNGGFLMAKVILIVLDSVGVGAQPDAYKFNDQGRIHTKTCQRVC